VGGDYQGCKDPDELIQKDAELWRAAVAAAVPAMDWLLDKYAEKLDLGTARGKREFSDMAVKMLGYLKDPVEVDHYEQEIARRLKVSVEALRSKKLKGEGEVAAKRVVKGEVAAVTKEVRAGLAPLEDKMIAISLVREGLRAEVKVGDLSGELHQELVKRAFMVDEKDGELYTFAQTRRLEFEGRYSGWRDDELAEEINGLKGEIDKLRSQKQKAGLERELADAELMGDEQRALELLGEINNLNRS
jgi:DNA primase